MCPARLAQQKCRKIGPWRGPHLAHGAKPPNPLAGGCNHELCSAVFVLRLARRPARKGTTMAWTTPTLVEICIGLEINGYLPAEF
jgi:coenzyme PQQ precursor peptide PqqA